ncbi:HalOD1 output domain-containing protein [Halocatena marina]|uniref:HalOD1 output domain-containing protein n=1 Tax=Halocatena marina TaxID=2934937 RepID=UPI00200D0ABD|nr:HalOD1 output domain-containing protein [Halocatena marina]
MSNISTDECVNSCHSINDAEVLEWRSITHCLYDHNEEGDLSTEITAAVADAEDTSVTTITTSPLFEVVDIFALEELFFGHSVGESTRDCDGQVQFCYRGFRVTVTSAGRITVAEPVREDTSAE